MSKNNPKSSADRAPRQDYTKFGDRTVRFHPASVEKRPDPFRHGRSK